MLVLIISSLISGFCFGIAIGMHFFTPKLYKVYKKTGIHIITVPGYTTKDLKDAIFFLEKMIELRGVDYDDRR